MLRIIPIQEKEKQAELCALCNVTFRPETFAYGAYVSGVFVGISQFNVCDEYGMIYDLAPAHDKKDIEALFIMGRQTMNWIDLLGIHTCRCRDGAASDVLIRTLGFTRDEKNILSADTTHMFEGHCGGNCNVAKELHENE